MAEKKVQPKSPKHEGVDPLADGDKLYPREDVKGDAEKLREEEAQGKPDTTSSDKATETVKDQKEVDAKDNTPNDLLPESDGSDAPKGKTSGSKTS